MRSLDKIRYAAGSAAMVAVVVLAAGTAPAVFAQNAGGSAADCRGEQGLTYVCNLVVPEDVVNVGSTGLVLASGHRAPGHLYLIDPATNGVTELIHGDAFRRAHDAEAYPNCPGPLNLEAFDVHGISIAETSPRRFRLYTTSHGEREAVEIYDLNLSGSSPSLAWVGCVLLQQDGYFNAVARLPDGGFVATRMRDANVNNADIAPGTITGRIFEWHPGGQLRALPGTELSLPNGIDVSADGRYVYVAATLTQELVRFDTGATPIAKRTVSLPMLPDNVHWDANGKLIVAGRNKCDAAACGWTAVEVDPETFAVTRLAGADPTAAMQRVSAAIRLGDELWIGSNEDRIARFTLR